MAYPRRQTSQIAAKGDKICLQDLRLFRPLRFRVRRHGQKFPVQNHIDLLKKIKDVEVVS